MTSVSLPEWQTLSPEPGNELYKRSLDAFPAGRRLAKDLTRTKCIEVLELAQGLELRSTSYVGRFSLGEVTVTVHPKISGAPLLNLFRYAYGLRNLKLYEPVDFASSKWAFQDLLIQQLADEASELIERGIQRDYERVRGNLANPRGRIDFSRYVQTSARYEATLPCIYFPRSEDTLLNRVLLAGLIFAAPLTTDPELKAHIRRLGKILSTTVTVEPISRSMIAEALRAMDRRTNAYKPALTLIELLLEGQGVALEEQGRQIQLKGFLFDMNRFFQTLISRFLSEHLSGLDVHDEFRLKGMFKYVAGQMPPNSREPVLRPDFVVMSKGQMLAVLDAKYRDLWEQRLPRDMLYQLALYALGRISGEKNSAILYPSLSSDARERSILIHDPVHGGQQGKVTLRPVNLLKLEQLIRAGQVAQSQRIALANRLAFGSLPQAIHH